MASLRSNVWSAETLGRGRAGVAAQDRDILDKFNGMSDADLVKQFEDSVHGRKPS